MEKGERWSGQEQGMPDQQGRVDAFDSEDRAEAVMTMIEIHGEEVDPEKVEEYLAVLHRLRKRIKGCPGPGERQNRT